MKKNERAKLQPRKSTPARAAASRRNGAKSRGPKTVAGKLNSRRNALVHGHTAKILTLDRESDDRFIHILAALEAELQPQTELEHELVDNIAQARWRTLRTWSQEKAVLDRAMTDVRRASLGSNQGDNPSAPTLRPADCGGQAFRNLADSGHVLAFIDRNENRYQRIYHRSIRELFRLRADRERADRIRELRELCEQTAKINRENAKTNPPSPTKQTAPEKSNPGTLEQLLRLHIPSEILEARIAAFRAQKRQPSSLSSVDSVDPSVDSV